VLVKGNDINFLTAPMALRVKRVIEPQIPGLIGVGA